MLVILTFLEFTEFSGNRASCLDLSLSTTLEGRKPVVGCVCVCENRSNCKE